MARCRSPQVAILMNKHVLPSFESHGTGINTVLERLPGASSCGRPDHHPYELFLQAGSRGEHRHHQSPQAPVQRLRFERWHRTPAPMSTSASWEGRSSTTASRPCRPTLDAYLVGYKYRTPPPGPQHEGKNAGRRLRPMPAQTENPIIGGKDEESPLIPELCRKWQPSGNFTICTICIRLGFDPSTPTVTNAAAYVSTYTNSDDRVSEVLFA